jgi:beta-galactosidase
MWGMAGEVDEPEKSADMVAGILNKYQQFDPSRVVTMHAPRAERVMDAIDVVGLYSTFEDDDRDHKNHPTRKYMIEEYTAAGIGRGLYGMGPDSEDLGCVEHEKFLSQVNLRPWIAGSVLWHQFDYDGEEYDPVIPHVVTFGMADSWRIPKDVFYFYQSQWSSEPVVHICGHWTWPDPKGTKRSVKVYSNLDEVELFLNGRSLGVKKGDDYPGLAHPPRIWEVPYQSGTLEAVARSMSKTIKDTRKTAGPAIRIDLNSDVKQVRSGDRGSLAYLTASVVDANGTIVPNAFHPISFTSYGPGELLPQLWAGHPQGFTWNAIAGMTRIVFRSTDRVGRSTISAYSPGLLSGRLNIDVAAKGKRDEIEYRSGATLYE